MDGVAGWEPAARDHGENDGLTQTMQTFQNCFALLSEVASTTAAPRCVLQCTGNRCFGCTEMCLHVLALSNWVTRTQDREAMTSSRLMQQAVSALCFTEKRQGLQLSSATLIKLALVLYPDSFRKDTSGFKA